MCSLMMIRDVLSKHVLDLGLTLSQATKAVRESRDVALLYF